MSSPRLSNVFQHRRGALGRSGGGSAKAQVVILILNPVVPLAVSPMSLDAGKGDKNRLPSGVARARRAVES